MAGEIADKLLSPSCVFHQLSCWVCPTISFLSGRIWEIYRSTSSPRVCCSFFMLQVGLVDRRSTSCSWLHLRASEHLSKVADLVGQPLWFWSERGKWFCLLWWLFFGWKPLFLKVWCTITVPWGIFRLETVGLTGRDILAKDLIHLLVPKRRLELPRGCPHMNLNHARLPIPPLRPYKSVSRAFLI